MLHVSKWSKVLGTFDLMKPIIIMYTKGTIKLTLQCYVTFEMSYFEDYISCVFTTQWMTFHTVAGITDKKLKQIIRQTCRWCRPGPSWISPSAKCVWMKTCKLNCTGILTLYTSSSLLHAVVQTSLWCAILDRIDLAWLDLSICQSEL